MWWITYSLLAINFLHVHCQLSNEEIANKLVDSSVFKDFYKKWAGNYQTEKSGGEANSSDNFVNFLINILNHNHDCNSNSRHSCQVTGETNQEAKINGQQFPNQVLDESSTKEAVVTEKSLLEHDLVVEDSSNPSTIPEDATISVETVKEDKQSQVSSRYSTDIDVLRQQQVNQSETNSSRDSELSSVSTLKIEHSDVQDDISDHNEHVQSTMETLTDSSTLSSDEIEIQKVFAFESVKSHSEKPTQKGETEIIMDSTIIPFQFHGHSWQKPLKVNSKRVHLHFPNSNIPTSTDTNQDFETKNPYKSQSKTSTEAALPNAPSYSNIPNIPFNFQKVLSNRETSHMLLLDLMTESTPIDRNVNPITNIDIKKSELIINDPKPDRTYSQLVPGTQLKGQQDTKHPNNAFKVAIPFGEKIVTEKVPADFTTERPSTTIKIIFPKFSPEPTNVLGLQKGLPDKKINEILLLETKTTPFDENTNFESQTDADRINWENSEHTQSKVSGEIQNQNKNKVSSGEIAITESPLSNAPSDFNTPDISTSQNPSTSNSSHSSEEANIRLEEMPITEKLPQNVVDNSYTERLSTNQTTSPIIQGGISDELIKELLILDMTETESSITQNQVTSNVISAQSETILPFGEKLTTEKTLTTSPTNSERGMHLSSHEIHVPDKLAIIISNGPQEGLLENEINELLKLNEKTESTPFEKNAIPVTQMETKLSELKQIGQLKPLNPNRIHFQHSEQEHWKGTHQQQTPNTQYSETAHKGRILSHKDDSTTQATANNSLNIQKPLRTPDINIPVQQLASPVPPNLQKGLPIEEINEIIKQESGSTLKKSSGKTEVEIPEWIMAQLSIDKNGDNLKSSIPKHEVTLTPANKLYREIYTPHQVSVIENMQSNKPIEQIDDQPPNAEEKYIEMNIKTIFDEFRENSHEDSSNQNHVTTEKTLHFGDKIQYKSYNDKSSQQPSFKHKHYENFSRNTKPVQGSLIESPNPSSQKSQIEPEASRREIYLAAQNIEKHIQNEYFNAQIDTRSSQK